MLAAEDQEAERPVAHRRADRLGADLAQFFVGDVFEDDPVDPRVTGRFGRQRARREDADGDPVGFQHLRRGGVRRADDDDVGGPLDPHRRAQLIVLRAGVAAARDLAAGTVLTPDDVRWVSLPVAVEPTGALTAMSDAVGHAVAGPIRDGEPITDVRLDGGAAAGGVTDAPLAPPGDGLVATPVRLADVQAAGLLRVGERVDVLAAIPRPGTPATSADSAASAASAVVVAEDVRVVATPTTPDGGSAALDSTAGDGALVVLATTPDQARSLAQAELTARLSAVVVR